MNERVVHLHMGRSVHPLYREQLHSIPPGFAYRASHPDLRDPTTPTRLIVSRRSRMPRVREHAERAALRALSRAGYLRRDRVRPEPGAALIHSAELLVKDAPLPYVVDFEHVEVFVLYQRIALSRPWARQRLRAALEDPRCRFVLPWTDFARRGLMAAIGPEASARINARAITVLPAIRPVTSRPRERAPGPLRLLFIGTAFLEKGGVEAVRAVRRLRATHDVRLELISYVPPEWSRELEGDEAITVHAPGGRDLVERLYAGADALLFPSHMDTYGYVVLEAMAHGVPVVAPGHQALPELVEHEVSGLLFGSENPLYGADGLGRFPHTLPPPRAYRRALAAPGERYVEGITRTLARLADEAGLHERLAGGALARVTEGPLSMQRRREHLAAIYAASLA